MKCWLAHCVARRALPPAPLPPPAPAPHTPCPQVMRDGLEERKGLTEEAGREISDRQAVELHRRGCEDGR
eukprot:765619-Hanusia_phi.AAC.2